jgi:hypothetical protein
MAGTGMTMDEFLNHSTRGGRGQVLKSWKDKGKILVWLSRKSRIHCLWRHQFMRVADLKDKPAEIWGDKFGCFETDEDVLRNQNFRDKDTKQRKHPPSCGYCRFLEDLYQEIVGGKMSWTEPVFRFRTPDGRTERIMYAGGLLGFFGSPKLTDDEKGELRDKGIFVKEAWKQVSKPKAEYVFSVVDDSDVKSGVQIAVETSGLGDKMRRVLRDQLKSRREKGDPYQNPYPFLWEYDDKAESFNEAYGVIPMVEEKLTPEIAKLIDGPPPNLDHIVGGKSRTAVRAMLEEHCCLSGIDWTSYLPDEAAERDSKDKDAPEVGHLAEDEQDDSPEEAAAPEAPPASEPDDMVACDGCETPMPATAPKCLACGKVYEVEQAAPAIPPPPPPPPLKKRSEAKRELAQKTFPIPTPPPAPPPTQSAQTAPATSPVSAGLAAAFEGSDDEIPFIYCDVARMTGERWWRWEF